MKLHTLRNEVREHLNVRGTVIAAEEDVVAVGRTFTVRFDVINTFEADAEQPGLACFTNVKLRLTPTTYADVLSEADTFKVADRLTEGESGSVDVSFKALRTLPVVVGIDLSEPYVIATAEADFDILSYFQIVREKPLFTQIEEA